MKESEKSFENYNPYGLRNGHIISVDELNVETEFGNRCNCICPKCKAPLIARIRGTVRRKHFAHDGTSDCVGAYESGLHLRVKEVIEEGAKIKLPPIVSSYAGGGAFVLDDVILCNSFVSGSTLIEPDKGKTEIEKDLGGIRPDIIIESSGHKLLIEVLVTHAVDDEKRNKIRDMGISCIEVDFSHYRDTPIDKNCIRKALAGNDAYVSIKWVFCNKLERFESVLKSYYPKLWLLRSTKEMQFKKGTKISELGYKHKILKGNTVPGCPLYSRRKLSSVLMQEINGRYSFSGNVLLPLFNENRILQAITGLHWDQALYNRCLDCEWNKGELAKLNSSEKGLIICGKGDDSSTESAINDACSMVIDFASNCAIPNYVDACPELIHGFIEALEIEENDKLLEVENEAIGILSERCKKYKEEMQRKLEEAFQKEKQQRKERNAEMQLRDEQQRGKWLHDKKELIAIIEDGLRQFGICDNSNFETWSSNAWSSLKGLISPYYYRVFSSLGVKIVFSNTAKSIWEEHHNK